jgi:hypothetical protein
MVGSGKTEAADGEFTSKVPKTEARLPGATGAV